DLEDLVNVISATEKGIDGVVFRSDDVPKWKGPYLQWTVDPSTTDIAGTAIISKSAAGTFIHSALYRCPAPSAGYATNIGDEPCLIYSSTSDNDRTDTYIAIKLTGIPASAGSEFIALNNVIDGKDETLPAISGLLRQNSAGTVFFLAAPYTKP
ncbi:MAG: hypothetical protein NUW01_08390, partial [Gemmatimonadaceae bacterium]|nr:hypothetical protein [Gemmatimonadaceae bacterium]